MFKFIDKMVARKQYFEEVKFIEELERDYVYARVNGFDDDAAECEEMLDRAYDRKFEWYREAMA